MSDETTQPTPRAEVEARALATELRERWRARTRSDVLASDWLADWLADYVQAAQDEERARIVRDIRERSEEFGRISVIRSDSWLGVAAYIEARGGAR